MFMKLVRDLAIQKKKDIEQNNKLDDYQQKIIILINNVLMDDSCFLKMDISCSLNLLIFLGYSHNEAMNIYVNLINESKNKLKSKYVLHCVDKIF